MYHMIRTAAYEPDPAHGPWIEYPYVMRLGEELHAEFSELYARVRGRSDQPVRLPVRGLNSLFRALAPGVVATGRGVAADAEIPWLYGREPVPREVVAPLLGTWAAGLLREHEGKYGGADRAAWEDQLLDGIDATWEDLPLWRPERIDLTETRISAGGTAEPVRRLFGLLPEWVAFRLAARPFRTGGSVLRFRVVSCENGAELVSWPPQRYESRKQTWYYSAVISVSVHTVPFTERFRVHVSYGIRRWATCLEIRCRDLSGTTVLLDAPLPWPDRPDRGHRLIGNTIKFDRKQGQVGWRLHSPARLLPDLDIVRYYPEPEDLLDAPEKWVNGHQGVAAGIVYSPGLGPHRVGPGLMPKERAELDTWVEEGLRPMLRRIPDMKRVTRNNTPSLLPRSTTTAEHAEARQAGQALARRKALVNALDGSSLAFDILWQSPETRTELLAALSALLGLPPGRKAGDADTDTWYWQADGLDISVRTCHVGTMAAPLKISGDRRRPRGVRLAQAIAERCALVGERMECPRDTRSLAIIEIGGKDRFTAPDTDPKHALRLACARQGRLSQFVNLPEDTEGTLRLRARWTWLDTFRQLGAISPPAHRVGTGIPGDLQYAALWLVRYTRQGPTRCPTRRLVAVRVRPDEGQGAIHGWDAVRSTWVPYPELLLSLAEDAAEMNGGGAIGRHRNGGVAGPGTEQQWRHEVERQVRALLFQLRDRPTLLLANAGNLRQCWPSLRNGALVKDALGFEATGDQRLAVYGPDLRVILTRDRNGRDEVPEWYAHDGKDKAGFSKGVWGPSDPQNRVFASTADAPHTAKLPKGLMKLIPAPGGRTAPGKSAWNPVHLELTVLGCLSENALAHAGREGEPADRPAEWATLTHQLRFHDDYPPLARPLPLHLARLAGEYVLPLATTSPSPPKEETSATADEAPALPPDEQTSPRIPHERGYAEGDAPSGDEEGDSFAYK
ncbi:DUF3962 domain-containing protein [Streptomyces sp. NPDC007100]|uniref:pPIWI_RE module domain-containing protein n=1 Tax=Streptomyces sp. NPDC007100 TaxID=3155602 RepID=UPI0033FC0104